MFLVMVALEFAVMLKKQDTKKSDMKTKQKQGNFEPVVCYGDVLPELRVRFWDYFSMSLLHAFARIAETGDLGELESFEGSGRILDGTYYAFSWRKNSPLEVRQVETENIPGYVLVKGRLDFETISRLRNFPLFHLKLKHPSYVG